MAGKFAATDVSIVLDALDISDYCFSVDVPDTKDQIDVSGFNPTSSREFLPGTRDQTVTLGVLQVFDSTGGFAAIHTKLNTLYTANSAFVFTIKPTSGSVSGTNPKYSGTAQMYEYDGLNAQLNARAEITVTLKPANGAVWAWATA
jgi:hypothetical protein